MRQTSDTTLHGRWLLLARLIWVALAIVFIGTFLASIPPGFEMLRTPCNEDCPTDVLTLSSEEVAVLPDIGLTLDSYATFQQSFQLLIAIFQIALVGLIFWRRSHEWPGLLFSGAMLMGATMGFSPTSEILALKYVWIDLLVNVLLSMTIVGLILVLLQFPDGRFVPWWTFPIPVLIGGLLLYASVVTEGMMFVATGALSLVLVVALLAGVGAAFFAQIYRYVRVSDTIQRQQTKWVVLGLALMIAVLFLWTFAFELFPPLPGPTRLYVNIFGGAIIYIMLLLYVLFFAIAILRYRLWDVDVLINRTLVYVALTASLALVYLAVVIGIQSVFRGITGQESDLAMVVSTLIIAVLFVPLRRRIQAVIDRRFYRKRYDAERTLAAFSTAARDEVDMARLSQALIAMVEDTMQPSHASLWLRET